MKRIFVLLIHCSIAFSMLFGQNTYDAAFLEYTGLRYACDGSITPIVKIQNIGTANMSSCVVETWKDGLMANTFNWILTVAAVSGEVRQPALPAIGGLDENDQLEFRIISVNGNPDEGAGNNVIAVPLDEVPLPAADPGMKVIIRTGEESQDVKWVIRDETALVVASGGPYQSTLTEHETEVPLDPSRCYQLFVDGISDQGMPQGQVELKSLDQTILLVEGEEISTSLQRGFVTQDECTEQLVLELRTDDNGSETSWQIVGAGTTQVYCSGDGYGNNVTATENCCLPEGCYVLRVFDQAGDGMAAGTNGGYILRMAHNNANAPGERIIDNRNNFLSGGTSALANEQGFCVPIGVDRPLQSSCDKLDWLSNQMLVVSLNPAVSAQLGISNATSGYEYWFFEPNGGYSFRRFRSFTNNDGYGSAVARPAHLVINNWAAANHIPTGLLLNVRVRGRVNGVNYEWGPACRFKIDPVAAACPTTKLMDIPSNQFLSCGQYRQFAPGQYVHARPVSGATQYQFRFYNTAEGYDVTRTSSSYFAQLWWTATPAAPHMVNNSQYQVEVRAFKGGQWCPWGEPCTLNIGTAPGVAPGNSQEQVLQGSEVLVWPNPSEGGELGISASGLPAQTDRAMVEITDLRGRQVLVRMLQATDGRINTVLDLDGIAQGTYVLKLRCGDAIHTRKLVISR